MGGAVKRGAIFVKSLLAGAAATLTDFGVFVLLHNALNVVAIWATVPALIAGGVVNFIGNRRYAFHAHRGKLTKQAQRFTVVTLIALGLNFLIFWGAEKLVPTWPAWLLRLIIGNVVYLAWSYPMFKVVFRTVTTTRNTGTPSGLAG